MQVHAISSPSFATSLKKVDATPAILEDTPRDVFIPSKKEESTHKPFAPRTRGAKLLCAAAPFLFPVASLTAMGAVAASPVGTALLTGVRAGGWAGAAGAVTGLVVGSAATMGFMGLPGAALGLALGVGAAAGAPAATATLGGIALIFAAGMSPMLAADFLLSRLADDPAPAGKSESSAPVTSPAQESRGKAESLTDTVSLPAYKVPAWMSQRGLTRGRDGVFEGPGMRAELQIHPTSSGSTLRWATITVTRAEALDQKLMEGPVERA